MTDKKAKTAVKSICLLVADIDASTGGVQKNSRLLLTEFRKRGIATYVCSRNYHGYPRKMLEDGTVFHRTPVIGKSLAINGIIYLVDCFFWLVKNRDNYDLVHCQQMFGPTMAAIVAGFITRKKVITRITITGEQGEVAAIKKMPLSAIRLQLVRYVSKWIALTSGMKAELTLLDIPEDKISVIHNGTEIPEHAAYKDNTKLKYRKKLGLDRGGIGVFTGRLSEEKGLDVLIRAWSKIIFVEPDAKLLLLGEGGNFRNVETKLKDLIAECGLEKNVHFLGHVSNPKDYIFASDVFILPSRMEGMSNSLVEAFACGAAIIASNIEANLEICTHNENSLIFKVDDVNELADSLQRVFSSPELGARLGKAARTKAETDLSLDTMISQYIEAYEAVCN